jgi:hypothetical protein
MAAGKWREKERGPGPRTDLRPGGGGARRRGFRRTRAGLAEAAPEIVRRCENPRVVSPRRREEEILVRCR